MERNDVFEKKGDLEEFSSALFFFLLFPRLAKEKKAKPMGMFVYFFLLLSISTLCCISFADHLIL